MQALIRDLLLYSRVTRDSEPPRVVETGAVLYELLSDLSATISEAGASLTVGTLPQVRARRTDVRQLLQNLVVNAIAHRGDAPPHIGISAARDGEMWRFAVDDNGPGVPEAHRARIFEVFSRLKPKRGGDGNGIGLAICRKVAERAGGRIWVEAAPGGGSRFCFTLPAADAPGSSPPSDAHSDQADIHPPAASTAERKPA